MEKCEPLEFLAKAQENTGLGARVLAAFKRGANLTTDEVIQIAHEFGYSFTRKEFEEEVKKDIARRFAAGDQNLVDVVVESEAPESACSRGCLSYSKTYHPPQVEES